MVSSNFLQTLVTYFDVWEIYDSFEEVTSTLLSEERRLSGESSETTHISALSLMENWKKNNSKKKGVCSRCGQLGHLKRDCHRINGARSISESRSNTDSITSGKSLIIMANGPL